ncbi:MAG: hypothetical protein RIS33_106 [Actinomycetota bacterium]|jgi:hypothetical protein
MSNRPERDDEPTPHNADAAMIERARRKYGSVGAVVASSMLGIERVLGRKPKEEEPAVWEASGEPGDIDNDGISIDVDDETRVVSHPKASRRTRRVVKRRPNDA